MKIQDFSDLFYRFEMETEFLKYQKNSVFIWDIFRHDLYYLIYHHICNNISNDLDRRPNLFRRAFEKLLRIIYTYTSFFLIRIFCIQTLIFRSPARFNITLRDYPIDELKKNVSSRNFSLNQHFILKGIKEDLILDSNFISNLTANINTFFGISMNIDLHRYLQERINVFTFEHELFLNLFKGSKINKIIINQRGIQKGLFYAAKSCNIKIIEVQHGYIGYHHPAYAYSKELEDYSSLYVPDFLLVFSNYWKEKARFYGGVKSIVLGRYPATQCLGPLKFYKRDYHALIIGSSDYHEQISFYLKKILKEHPSLSICYKLHQNQITQFDTISKEYSDFKNVKIISGKKSIIPLFNKSSCIIAVQSTSVYEALQCGLDILLIPEYDYGIHEDIFNRKNVYILDRNKKVMFNFNLNKEISSSEDTVFFEQIDISSQIKLLINI